MSRFGLFALPLFALPRLAAAADAPPSTITLTAPDHSLELTARAGLLFGGEITPKGQLVGEAAMTPLFVFADTSFIAHPMFTAGAYLSVASAGYQQFIRDDVVGDGTFTIFGMGAVVKARFSLSEKLTLRAGVMLGLNLEWASVKRTSGTFDATGSGLNIAPTLEVSYRVAPRWGLSGQFGFLSQPVGSADLGGRDSVDFKIPPMIFLAVGPELFL